MSKYQRIIEVLKEELASSQWKTGDKFLGVHDVCSRFNVSHLTAVKVLDGLVKARLVEARRGSGTFVSGLKKRICFLSPDLGLSKFYPIIRSEISELCSKNKIELDSYEVGKISSSDFSKRLTEAAETIIRSSPSGIIYLPSSAVSPYQDLVISTPYETDRSILSSFHKAKIPVILIDSGIDGQLDGKHDLVGVDNRAIGMMLGLHLLKQHAKHILFVSWRSYSQNIQDRLSGLKDATLNSQATVASYELTQSNIKDFVKLVKSRKKRPDAIVGSSDRVASMVLHLLSKAKISVPDDVLLSGIDGTELSSAAKPDMTTVLQPFREIARAACETILGRIARPSAPARHVMIATSLVICQSTCRDSNKQKPSSTIHEDVDNSRAIAGDSRLRLDVEGQGYSQL